MNTVPFPAAVATAGNYLTTGFNALQHGVLSRYTVLPWEDEGEYRTLLDALVADHAPQGPTEEHLVEELTGIIWRKRRLRIAEAAIYREKLRSDVGPGPAPPPASALHCPERRPVAGSDKLDLLSARILPACARPLAAVPQAVPPDGYKRRSRLANCGSPVRSRL